MFDLGFFSNLSLFYSSRTPVKGPKKSIRFQNQDLDCALTPNPKMAKTSTKTEPGTARSAACFPSQMAMAQSEAEALERGRALAREVEEDAEHDMRDQDQSQSTNRQRNQDQDKSEDKMTGKREISEPEKRKMFGPLCPSTCPCREVQMNVGKDVAGQNQDHNLQYHTKGLMGLRRRFDPWQSNFFAPKLGQRVRRRDICEEDEVTDLGRRVPKLDLEGEDEVPNLEGRVPKLDLEEEDEVPAAKEQTQTPEQDTEEIAGKRPVAELGKMKFGWKGVMFGFFKASDGEVEDVDMEWERQNADRWWLRVPRGGGTGRSGD